MTLSGGNKKTRPAVRQLAFVYKIFQGESDMKMYLLTRSDGYSIESVMQTLNQDEAKDLLRKEYAAHTPSEWMEEYKELSSCNDMNAVLYSNGEDVYVWQIIEATVPTAQSEELNIYVDSCGSYERDQLYRHLWMKHVVEDITSHLGDIDTELTDEEIEAAAKRYVYDGDYDCNLDYWSNIENVIYRVIEAR